MDEQEKIISIKTVCGDLLSGVYCGTSKVHGRDTHSFSLDGLQYYVPVIQCDWWALGEKSSKEVDIENGLKMKQQAKEVLMEHLQSASQAEKEDASEQSSQLENQEKLRSLLETVRDEKRTSLQESIRNIANHQQLHANSTPETEIIQPEGSSIKRRDRATISRLEENDEDY